MRPHDTAINVTTILLYASSFYVLPVYVLPWIQAAERFFTQ